MNRFVLLTFFFLATLTGKAQYQLDTIAYAGPSNVFTDIVFLGDGFQSSEMQTFVNFVNEQVNTLFTKVPWSTYRNRFNIFYVKTPSSESGAGMTPDKPKDTVYGVCFGTSGVDRMPWPTNWGNVYDVLWATKPDYDVVCIVTNSMKYGGGGGGGFLCYSMEESSHETLRHELGHAFGGLCDEYWYTGREAENMTQNINPVKWSRWLGYKSVGTYRYDETPGTEAYTWYRPHQSCEMRYLYRDYCAVCHEALIRRIHETSLDILSYQPTEKKVSITDDCLFSLNLAKPDPNTLRVVWSLDGQCIGYNVDEVKIAASSLNYGQPYQLTAAVEDTTLLVRPTDQTTLHVSTVTWTVESLATGIALPSITENDFSVGPLPFSSSLTFTMRQPCAQPIRLELYDMTGRTVARKTVKDETTCTLTPTRLSDGIYILRVYQGKHLLYSRKVTRKG